MKLYTNKELTFVYDSIIKIEKVNSIHRNTGDQVTGIVIHYILNDTMFQINREDKELEIYNDITKIMIGEFNNE